MLLSASRDLIWRGSMYKDYINPKPISRLVRCVARRRDVIFHGTRYPRKIIHENRLTCRTVGHLAISFTRSPEIAAYWALLYRDSEEARGAVLVIDRTRLRCRYRLLPYHDTFWDEQGKITNEFEECVPDRSVKCLSDYLIAVIWEGCCCSAPYADMWEAGDHLGDTLAAAAAKEK